MSPVCKRRRLTTVGRVLAALLISTCLLSCDAGPEPIKIGILHSFSGPLASSEKAVAEASTLAIEELNAAGGLIGRPLEIVVADGKSDPKIFAAEAERLITEENVAVIFGCWTSASRKEVRPVVESNDILLFYPVQYEGLESSPTIVYTGSTPNQQILPAVDWAIEQFGPRLFVVGSDYVFPRAAAAVLADYVASTGANILGEKFVPLGSMGVDDLVDAVLDARPDVVVNLINGDTNTAFFSLLEERGASPSTLPVLSFSIAEEEARSIGTALLAGHYAAWTYFQSIPSDANAAFVAAYRHRYGSDRVTDDPIEAGYFGVHLWAQTVESIGTVETASARARVRGLEFSAPGGRVLVDPQNLHTWKTCRIGRFLANGQLEIVWQSERPIAPRPYPASRKKTDWELFMNDLREQWGGGWSAAAQ
jgi:urea transport system substrate-binding protein